MRILLIGASGAFGSALLRAAAEFSVNVVKISRGHGDGSVLHCDLSNLASITPSLMQIDDVNAGDVAFINSGVLGSIGLGAEIEITELVNAININALSNIPIFKTLYEKGVWKYVITSSGAAHTVYSGWFLYCLSKSLQKSIWVSLCHDYPEISARLIAPGVLRSGMHDFTSFVEEGRYPELKKFYRIKDNDDYQNVDLSATKIIDMLRQDSFFSSGAEFIDLRNI